MGVRLKKHPTELEDETESNTSALVDSITAGAASRERRAHEAARRHRPARARLEVGVFGKAVSIKKLRPEV